MRGLLLLLTLSACGSKPAPEPVVPSSSDNGSGSGAPGAELAVRCHLTVAEQQVELLELRSDDGRCRLYLPATVMTGSLPLRVGSGSGEQVALLEAGVGDETFYASEGSASVTVAAGGRLQGRAVGRDANPPGMATIAVDFDLARGTP